jgi:hypothetical protein
MNIQLSSFIGMLTIVFITLKLLGKIAWSWWWVLSPMWIPAIGLLLIFIVCIILDWNIK